MVFAEFVKETFNAGDPTVRSWTLVNSAWTPFICSGLYVFFVKHLGPDIMLCRKPFDLRNLMIIYNFCIVFAYTGCLYTLLYYLFTTDGYKIICSPCVIKNNHYTYTCASVAWYLYLLKYVEYADTIFFILRKKSHLVTNLHVIHHALLPILGWVLLRTETSGFQFIPGGINSFIHIIMYTYYGLAAMGPEVQKKLWWKEHLTLLQMTQFVVILFFMFVIIPLSGCKTSTHGVYMNTAAAILFLALFVNFYKKTYKERSNVTSHHLHNGHNGDCKKTDSLNGDYKKMEEYKKTDTVNGDCITESEILDEFVSNKHI